MHEHTHCMNTLVMYTHIRAVANVCLSVCLSSSEKSSADQCETIYGIVLYSVRQDVQCGFFVVVISAVMVNTLRH